MCAACDQYVNKGTGGFLELMVLNKLLFFGRAPFPMNLKVEKEKQADSLISLGQNYL